MKKVNHLQLLNRKVLRISGSEKRVFLQGLISNDVMRVSNKCAIYAALLTPQGKYLHDFFILEFKNDFYLDCEADRIEDLFRRFRMFKLRSDIQIEIVEQMTVTVFFGDYVYDQMPIGSSEGEATNWLDGVLFTDPRLKKIGTRAILPKNSLESSKLGFQLILATFEEYDTLRINLGLPDSGRDLLIEKSILLESGFEELNGVDFEKGCYVGQELTARTKYRGLIKKRLIPVKFTGTPPESGTEIRKNNKKVGEIRSVSNSSALAILSLDSLDKPGQFIAGKTTLLPDKAEWANF